VSARRLPAALSIAALALGAGAVSCGGGDDESPAGSTVPADLVIGDLVPLRGDLAPFGPAARKAADLAARGASDAASTAQIDAAVRAVHYDTETNDQIAEVLARRLIEDDDAACVVGDWPTTGTFAVGGNVTVPASIPLISPASSSFELTNLNDRDLVFRTVPSDDLQAKALSLLAARSIGGAEGRTLAIATRADLYGRRFARTLAEDWRQLGGEISGPVLYDPGRPRLRSEAQDLVAGDPDAYAVIDFPDGLARLARELDRLDSFRPGRLFLPDVLATDDVRDFDIPPGAVSGARGTLPGAIAAGPEGDFFRRRFGDDADAPPRPAGFSAQTFDAVTLCFLAALAAGSADGAEIAGELAAVSSPPGTTFGPRRLGAAIRALREGEEIDYQGASGPIDLDAAGDPQAAVFDVFTYADGRLRRDGQIEAKR
jgi:ABC-type branched-subunit amino acid transport system substrate-binding protein